MSQTPISDIPLADTPVSDVPVTGMEEEVLAIVSRITKTPVSQLTPETDLRVELNVDSLQGLQIVAALEKRFGITVPDDEIDMYSNVRTIVETLERAAQREAVS